MRSRLEAPFRRLTSAHPETARFAVPPLVEARRLAGEGLAAPAAALPFAERLQRSFGRHRVEGIQAHLGPRAEAGALQMGAAAYAMGEHVVLGAQRDLRTVAHEAAHVVQQRAGVAVPGGIGRPGDVHERQAEEVADRVAAGRSAEDLLDRAGSVRGEPLGARLERPAAAAPRPIQQLNLGWVPAVPNNWRGFTNLVGNTPATDGFGKFSKANRLAVEANNIAQKGAGPAPVIVAGNYPASDTIGPGPAGGALLDYATARAIAPEADHMIPRADGGANDLENVRLLSKAENTNPVTQRPKIPAKGGLVKETSLRMYTPINLRVQNPAGTHLYGLAAGAVIPSGSKLTFKQLNALHLWAGGAAPLAKWSALTVADQKAIAAKPVGGGWAGTAIPGGHQVKVW